MKKGMLIGLAVLMTGGCALRPEPLELSVEKREIMLGEELEIHVDEGKISSVDAFGMMEDSQIIEKDGKYFFEAFVPGTYSILASQDGATSEAILIDVCEKGKDPTERPKTVDVAWVLDDPESFVDRQVTLLASLPQMAAVDENGDFYPVALPVEREGGMLRLNGRPVEIGSCLAQLDGVLKRREEGHYEFWVEDYQMVLDGAARTTNQ